MFLRFIIAILLTGCTEHPKPDTRQKTYLIVGRDTGRGESPPLIYRVKVFDTWKIIAPRESIHDSTKPLCEFYLQEGSASIRITVHNFPVDSKDKRIPPQAQISRWKKQFEKLDHHAWQTKPVASAGFEGLYFEAEGILQGIDTKMIGWSMQLCSEHYQSLIATDFNGSNESRQRRADYTIKAVGPSALVDKYLHAIVQFANSFELIEEIPIHK